MIRVLFICTFLSGNAMAENHEVEPFINEVQKYKFKDFNALNEAELKKGLSYYGEQPTIYEEKELRVKAEEMMQQSANMADDESLSAEERAISSAGASIKSSFARESKYSDIDQETWMKKSELVTENPLIGLNSDCAVSAEVNDKVEVKYEPYEVEVDSVREVESEETCEEDGTEIHKCYETLNIHVDKQENCDAGAIEYLGVEGINRASGLYNVKWSYSYPLLLVSITATNLHDYRPHHPPTTSKKIFFNIKDKSLISAFILNTIEIQGVATILLNGHLLYGTPGYPYVQTDQFIATESRRGGSSHYYINGKPYNKFFDGKTHTAPSMDLLSYIKAGKNELTITGIPTDWAGYKLTNIYIEAKQDCSKVVENWTNDCGGL